jgi:hypothetical protein
MTPDDLIATLGELEAAPHDEDVRGRVDAALSSVHDPNVLADALFRFPVEIEVVKAVEPRLRKIGPEHNRAWNHVARTYLMFASTDERRAEVLAIVRGILARDPNNREALETAIMLFSGPRPAPEADLLNWSERLVSAEDRDLRAIEYRVKVLLKLGRKEDALDFLRRTVAALQSTPPQYTEDGTKDLRLEALDATTDLIRRIEEGDGTILQQW